MTRSHGEVSGPVQGSRRLVTPTWIMLRGSHGDVSGFRTIVTYQDGLKNSRDKSATSPFASGERGNRRRPRQDTEKSATSRTNQRGRHGFVADVTSRRSRHSGIWALLRARRPAACALSLADNCTHGMADGLTEVVFSEHALSDSHSFSMPTCFVPHFT